MSRYKKDRRILARFLIMPGKLRHKARMSYMLAKGRLTAFVDAAAARGLKFALRHARLAKKVYEPWAEAKIAACGIFDRDFYIKKYIRGEIVIEPFRHYFQRGRFYHLQPNEKFNPVFYKLRVMSSASRLSPPLHYALRKNQYSADCGENSDLAKNRFSERFWDILEMCRRFRVHLDAGTPILDFGCGEGATVAELVEAGYDAYGFDIVPRLSGKALSFPARFRFNESGVKKGENDASPNIDDYRLNNAVLAIPFPDDFFSMVLSFEVFEHVFNMENTLQEISRILRPGAWAFHVFPLKSCFLERHSNIPLGHRLHRLWYCKLWAALGVAGRKKTGTWREIAQREYDYIENALNYHTREQILRMARPWYSEVKIIPWPAHVSLNPVRELWKKIFPPNILLACKK